MDLSKEKSLLQAISEQHRYTGGFNGRLTKYRALKIREVYHGGGSLLDLGAGEGVLTAQIAGGFRNIFITEASLGYLEQAKINLAGYPVTFFNTLIEEFETDERFDLILASGVLEHVHSTKKVLTRLKGWLKHDGIFIAIVPNATSLHRQVGMRMGIIKNCHELGELDHRVGHRRYYNSRELTDDIVGVGFHVIKSGGILLKPLPNEQMEKLSEEYCDALYQIGNEYPEICAEIYIAGRIA